MGEVPYAQQGRIIVIDGPDGTGKATTTKLVMELLQTRKPFGERAIRTLSFPNYLTPEGPINDTYSPYYGRLVRDYLDGDNAHHDRVVPAEARNDPFLASLVYAADRRLASEMVIKPGLAKGDIFVFDRYVISNSAHQAAKILDPEKAWEFPPMQQRMEYENLGIPRPDVTILLDLPDDIRERRTHDRRLADRRAGGSGTGQVGKTDIHEDNKAYMARVAEMYRKFIIFDANIQVSGIDGDRELSPEEVAEVVYGHVLRRLSDLVV